MSLTKHIIKNSTNVFRPFPHVNFGALLNKEIQENYRAPFTELVFLCIGPDRSTGDSLGPLIGYKLKNMILPKKEIHIIGTLEDPVHVKKFRRQDLKCLHLI